MYIHFKNKVEMVMEQETRSHIVLSLRDLQIDL